ncbi:hypothetical protein MNV49_004614 [Pseudohyphozyma bogoriensis]|nr:hypothetical protein MNV49_004614 [Pseudohyphozyma bogoriensis]
MGVDPSSLPPAKRSALAPSSNAANAGPAPSDSRKKRKKKNKGQGQGQQQQQQQQTKQEEHGDGEKEEEVKAPTRPEWGLTTGRKTYSALNKLVKGSNWNAIAVATRSDHVKKLNSGDWMAALKLYDPTKPSFSDSIGLNVFRRKEGVLPDFDDDAAVLVLQGFNRSEKDVNIQSSTGYHDRCDYAVFRIDDLLADKVAPRPISSWPHAAYGAQEIEYAKDLAKWWRVLNPEVAAIANTGAAEVFETAVERTNRLAMERGSTGSRRQLREIKDLRADEYSDVIGEIFRIHIGGYINSSALATLEISDFTANSLLYDYQEHTKRDWRGPWGQKTLQLEIVGDANVRMAERLGDGDLIYVRNMRAKMSSLGFLEGIVWEDLKFPDKSDVKLLTESSCPAAYKAMVARRDILWPPRDKRGAARRQSTTEPRDVAPSGPAPEAPASSVYCQFAPQPVASMKVMQTKRSEGIHYRLRGKIIDYRPNRLQDWILVKCATCDEPVPKMMIKCDVHDGTNDKVKISFCFHLAIQEVDGQDKVFDKAEYIQVAVTPDYADQLLPGLKPTLEMRDGTNLEPLRRRLAPLIAGIENRKRDSRNTDILVTDLGQAFDFAVVRGKDVTGGLTHRFVGTEFREPK